MTSQGTDLGLHGEPGGWGSSLPNKATGHECVSDGLGFLACRQLLLHPRGRSWDAAASSGDKRE